VIYLREDPNFRITTRQRLYEDQGRICVYCKEDVINPTLDHIIPILHIEDNNDCYKDNYVVCCEECNKSKGEQIIFSNLIDREIYPIIETPYFFRSKYIQFNKKDNT